LYSMNERFLISVFFSENLTLYELVKIYQLAPSTAVSQFAPVLQKFGLPFLF